MKNNDIEIIKEVLNSEANAMLELAEKVNLEYIRIIELIISLKGRLIVTGMGKSGHVAKKIAATLASLGTPSFFVHPGEASHGDLGMITEDDAVLAISNSGETKELADIISYTRRFSIPLISISKNSDSTLGAASDYHIDLDYEKEACPLALAPTTSTTLTLAIGDAIAIALLKRKSFSAKNFGDFHPGGKLGSSVLKNEKIMNDNIEDLPLIELGSSMAKAIDEMSDKNLGCVGVVDKNLKLVGIITDGDIRRHIDSIMKKTVNDVMTITPITVKKDALAGEGLAIMNNNGITTLFVTDDEEKVIGIIHMHNYLKQGVM